MKKFVLPVVIALLLILLAVLVHSSKETTASPFSAATSTSPMLSITPKTILEGDPVMIVVKNSTLNNIKSVNVGTTPLHFTLYKGSPTALYGSSINQETGTVEVKVVLKDDSTLTDSFKITARTHPSENLPVPEQLGGNSTTSQAALVSNLAKENAEIATVKSDETQSFWTAAFAYPIHAPIIVTDEYGYNRESGAETIIHKGTDFKAPPGTPVYAVNDGIVLVAKPFTIYGNTIIVDHGFGIESFYMHLSEMAVTPHELVTKGELIGHSGTTGYAEGPHLHLSIRINGSSIDPMKFFGLF